MTKKGKKENEKHMEAENSTKSGEVTEQTSQDAQAVTKDDTGEQTTQLAEKELLEQKVNELQDKYLRLSAEFDNYRKRTLREKSDLIKTAGEDLLKRLLPIKDDFERGLAAMENTQEITPVKQGIELIYSKFNDFFTQNGVKEIESRNQDFNTDIHDAITKIPAPEEHLKGKVVDVIEKGYMLGDKVLRFSKVVVGE